MIVFDLRCGTCAHGFEAWFGSGAAYDTQEARGLLACPMCGGADIAKAAMAPAVPAKSNQRKKPAAPVPVAGGVPAPDARQREALAALVRAQAEMLKDSQWVGDDFAEVARAMHYGERDARPVHGEVTGGEVRSLIEEGVPVAPLLVPVVPPEMKN